MSSCSHNELMFSILSLCSHMVLVIIGVVLASVFTVRWLVHCNAFGTLDCEMI